MKALYEFDQAMDYDPSLKYAAKSKNLLACKYLKPQKYSRQRLYDNMFAGNTVVFSDYPLTLTQQDNETPAGTIIRMLKEGLPPKEKIFIRSGISHTKHKVTIENIIDRWLRQRSKFGVTDLHFRGTKLYNKIDTDSISYFNLLPLCPDDVSFLEMLTLVVSSKGIFTDSHSDDGDGSNHCFIGKKLWLAWDRIEGQKHGLQDCSDDNVTTRAKFNMNTFASLKSSHWFTVTNNQTLFMPGNFTHKVITLESYIGFGSFYVSLPNYFNAFKRWMLYKTEYVTEEFLETMNTCCIKKIKKISDLPQTDREKWGLNYLSRAADRWQDGLTSAQITLLSKNEMFMKLVLFASSTQN